MEPVDWWLNTYASYGGPSNDEDSMSNIGPFWQSSEDVDIQVEIGISPMWFLADFWPIFFS